MRIASERFGLIASSLSSVSLSSVTVCRVFRGLFVDGRPAPLRAPPRPGVLSFIRVVLCFQARNGGGAHVGGKINLYNIGFLPDHFVGWLNRAIAQMPGSAVNAL